MYKIMGADQKEYGPVESGKIREWIAQGRANGQTIASFENGPWKPLSSFPEFADALRASAPPPLPQMSYAVPGVTPIKSNSVSVWGLTCSILGLCCLPCFPFSIAGIICSAIGLSQINKEPQKYTTSKVIPIAGLILGVLAFIGIILGWATGLFKHLLENIPQ